jgi:hypothetical protein
LSILTSLVGSIIPRNNNLNNEVKFLYREGSAEFSLREISSEIDTGDVKPYGYLYEEDDINETNQKKGKK